MRSINLFSLLTTVILLSGSCSRNSDDVNSIPGQAAIPGAWKVSLFTDSGNNETGDFAGYNFTFGAAGVLTVVKSGVTTNGTWSVNSSSSKFIIDLGVKVAGNLPLGELTDDWKILSKGATEIKLGDDNPVSNEFLTFTKN
jgi:hypothetical protein